MEVCQNQTSMGYQYNGGFAEYMIVPREVLKVDGLNRIPDNIGFDEASAAEPLACAINAQSCSASRRATPSSCSAPDPSAACTSVSRAASTVRAGLPDRRQRRAAQDDGRRRSPDEVINGAEVDVVARVKELTDGRGADAIITATAANIAQEQAIAMAARNGKISLLWRPAKDQPDHHGATPTSCTTASSHLWGQRLGAGAQQAGA